MRMLRSPITLEQRRRRQRFWENVRQLALMVALAVAFTVGLIVGARPSAGTKISTQPSRTVAAAAPPLNG